MLECFKTGVIKEKDRVMELIKAAQEKEFEVCIWGAGNAGTTGINMLKKMDITVDYFCDRNPELWGKEIVDGIKCISVDEILNKDIICFIMVSIPFIDEVCREAHMLGIERVVTYDELCDLEIETYFPFMKKKQIAAYTCIVGNYDKLQEPVSISEECDYYVISDKRPSEDSVFQYIDINDCIPHYIEDNVKKNRYCKINAHKMFSQYRYSIYFDGNIRLKNNIVKKTDELPQTRIMASGANPINCVYKEAMRAIELGRVSKEVATKQVEKYWLEGMPEKFGSVVCSLLIREHNNPICEKIMEDWWEQVEQFSRKDQISFPYVIWKNNYLMSDVATVNGNELYADDYFVFSRTHDKPRYTKG